MDNKTICNKIRKQAQILGIGNEIDKLLIERNAITENKKNSNIAKKIDVINEKIPKYEQKLKFNKYKQTLDKYFKEETELLLLLTENNLNDNLHSHAVEVLSKTAMLRKPMKLNEKNNWIVDELKKIQNNKQIRECLLKQLKTEIL